MLLILSNLTKIDTMVNLGSSEDVVKARFKGKKVLILGLGVNQGGVGATKFFVTSGSQVRVTDIKNEENLTESLRELAGFTGVEYTLGEHKYEDIDWADLIIKNPAIKPDNPYLLYAINRSKQIETDFGIFLMLASPTQLIGITGTKGKSTTSTLIYEILRKNNDKVLFAGNIGKSVLETIPYIKPDSIIILELSSFQLEAFEKHQAAPHIAVITNILPDHLNYYETMDQYIAAKKVIAQEQEMTDFLVLGKDDPITTNPQFLRGLNAQVIYFSPDDLPADFSMKMQGEYNKWNAAAALAVAKISDVSEKDAIEVIKNFNGVEYRLQLIKEINGLRIYNDSASTMPDSAIWAIKSLKDSILICGGMNKKLDYTEMAKAIATDAKMIFFIDGDATDEIKKLLLNQDFKLSGKMKGTYSDLEKLLADIKAVAKPGDTILFSPGATSFNFFQNEFDRARKFNAAVDKVFPS